MTSRMTKAVTVKSDMFLSVLPPGDPLILDEEVSGLAAISAARDHFEVSLSCPWCPAKLVSRKRSWFRKSGSNQFD